MLYLLFCFTLLQDPLLPSWEHHLSQLIFEGGFATENMVLMGLEQGSETGLKIVADGVALDFNIRIYSLPKDSLKEDNDDVVPAKERVWVIGEIQGLHTREPPGFAAWSLQFPDVSSLSKTEDTPDLLFSRSMQRIIYTSAEELMQAIDRGVIHGWVCPSMIDQVLKNKTRSKTLRVYTQKQKFYWWTDVVMLHQESSLMDSLNRLIQCVSRFQGSSETRHQVLNQFIATTSLKGKSHAQIHGALKGYIFLQAGAGLENLDLDPSYIDSRWLNLTRRMMPPVPAHLLELTVH